MKENKDLRDIIMTSALKIFSEEGAKKVTMRAIATESNIALGTIYNYFKTKDEILISITENFWKEMIMELAMQEVSNDDFTIQLDNAYKSLYTKFFYFKSNLLDLLKIMSVDDKKVGLDKESHMQRQIKKFMENLLDNSNDMKDYSWTDDFKKDDFIAFIFKNIEIALKEGSDNIDFLLAVLKKI